MKNLSGLHRRILSAHTSTGVVRRAYWVKDQSPHVPANAPVKASVAPSSRVDIHYGMLGSKAVNKAIDDSMRAIGQVHGIPSTLHKLPVYVTGRLGAGQGSDVAGAYYPSGEWAWSSQAKINVNKHAAWPMATMVHEYGHYLDHHLFGSVTQHSTMDSTGTTRRSPELKGLMQSIFRSSAVKQLIEAHATHEHDEHETTVSYFLKREELFARAYAQWIGSRSSHPQLRSEITEMGQEWRNFGLHTQWDRDDFKPIGREFDRLFFKRGLLRRSR